MSKALASFLLCPKCLKPTSLNGAAALNDGTVTFVYGCGHLEVKTKLLRPADIQKEKNK